MRARSMSWALLALVACQPEAESTELSERLAATEEQLAATQAQLDAVQTKLDATTKQLEELEKPSAARPPPPLPRANEPWAPNGLDPSEAIQCEGFDTPKVTCKLDRELVDTLFETPGSLIRQARIVPTQQDGSIRGYKLYGIRPDSLPKLLGFKNGDTITSVDGESIGSLDAAMQKYEELRTSEKVALGVERKGKLFELTIEVAKK